MDNKISYFKVFMVGAIIALGIRFGDSIYTKYINPKIIKNEE